jgi:hypothetical protein
MTIYKSVFLVGSPQCSYFTPTSLFLHNKYCLKKRSSQRDPILPSQSGFTEELGYSAANPGYNQR